MSELLRRLAVRWEQNRDADEKSIAAFNKLSDDERRRSLARFLTVRFLCEEAVDEGRGPWEARQFIDWLEDGGALLTAPVGVFEAIGPKGFRMEIAHPERVMEWLTENLEDGSWSVEIVGRPPLQRYKLTMTDTDVVLFKTRWK